MSRYNKHEVILTPDLIQVSRAFAIKVHKDQMYGKFPYSKHLEDVYNVLVKFGFSENIYGELAILIASFLHDSIEDANVSYSTLNKTFGRMVADIVYDVTDERGKSRKEKHLKTYPKTRNNIEAITLKVADRIANTESSLISADTDLYDMYKSEFWEFKRQLRVHRHLDDMWDYLEDLYNK